MYYYYDNQGTVKMVSTELIETIFNNVWLDDTNYEGYSMTYINGKLNKIKIN